MNRKKTWFSYILWLFATGFSILFTYSHIRGIVTCYSLPIPNPVYSCMGLSALFILVVFLLYLLLQRIHNSMVGVSLSKRGRRSLHVLIVCGLMVLFVLTRSYALFSTSLEKIVPMELFDAAKVMLADGQTMVYESSSVMEELYINVLSGMFLFLGNKIEIMLFFQIVLQTVSFFLLLFIGRTLQNGFLSWFPALVYTLSQYCMDSIVCLNADNFSFFIVLLFFTAICFLEKAWKNKTVTYILIALTGVGFAIFLALDAYPHVLNDNFVWKFLGYELLINGAAEGFIGVLLLLVFVFFYCISFWKTKTEQASLYILPIVSFSLLLYFDLYADSLLAVFMLIRIYLSFMAAEGLRILFEPKLKVMAEKKADADIMDCNAPECSTIHCLEKATDDMATCKDVEEGDFIEKISEQAVEYESLGENPEDTGVIRVSDILKTLNVEDTSFMEEKKNPKPEEVTDKTAMIENVLPMPKKHVSRTFEYAFEPTEDMMHYDLELENDNYDYE